MSTPYIASLSRLSYEYISWGDYFVTGNMNIYTYHISWHILFSMLYKETNYIKLVKTIKKRILDGSVLFPSPQYVYAAFIITPATKLKVVFIGQDPYHTFESIDGKIVPNATGLSFSVPHEVKIPSSLNNIFENLIKYKHISKKPSSGNLWKWAAQGCLMLNTALTVEKNNAGSHAQLWEWTCNYIIQYISQNMDDIIFVLWGSHAYNKISLIDIDKHHTIISSHPSGLSAHSSMRGYPAFSDQDHFGMINNILKKKDKIIWDL